MSYDISNAQQLTPALFETLIALKTPHVGRYIMPGSVAKVMMDSHNKNNRKLKNIHVQNLMDEIQDDSWVFTSEPAIFDRNGQMSNGQHRIDACAKTDKSLDILIVFGMDPEVIWAMDRCKPRNNGDTLFMNDVKNASDVSPVVTHYFRFLNNNYLDKWEGPSGKEAMEVFQSNPGIEDSVQLYRNKFKGICTTSVGIFFHYLLTKIDPDKGQDFINRLITGENLEATNPILQLRKQMVEKSEYKKLSTQTQMVYIVKTWNRFYDGEKAIRLNYTPKRGKGDKRKGDAQPVIRGTESFFNNPEEFVNPFISGANAAA
jgi:hypothetical protein